jgi:hypothetical protein
MVQLPGRETALSMPRCHKKQLTLREIRAFDWKEDCSFNARERLIDNVYLDDIGQRTALAS